jgi:hypothetical protein
MRVRAVRHGDVCIHCRAGRYLWSRSSNKVGRRSRLLITTADRACVENCCNQKQRPRPRHMKFSSGRGYSVHAAECYRGKRSGAFSHLVRSIKTYLSSNLDICLHVSCPRASLVIGHWLVLYESEKEWAFIGRVPSCTTLGSQWQRIVGKLSLSLPSPLPSLHYEQLKLP